MKLANLISLASTAARIIELGTQTLGQIRGVVAREQPADLEAFDAAVAAARAPWSEAAAAAEKETEH